VRIDTHVEAGYVVPPFYDSLLCKVIVRGETRAEAIERSIAALEAFVCEGPATTIALGNPDAPPVAPVTGGYSIQLGAFANFANAQAFLAHAQNQLATARVEAKIRQSGGLYRVYLGPYAARNEAERIGERITQAFGFATTIAPH
jgi:cell division septation protein DedD